MQGQIFSEHVKFEPYWWEAAPRPVKVERAPPETTDVAVVGSGYSGLAAALVLARGGRHVTVLEARALGYGASSRNGGMCGDLLKPGYAELGRRYGDERARAILREARLALDHLIAFIEAEQIQCQFRRTGRFIAAHNRRRYQSLARECELMKREFGVESHMVPRNQQETAIGSARYHGGRVIPHHGGLHPGLYHQGLLDRVLAAGATVLGETPVTGIERDKGGFRVATTRGIVRARDVVVATNGYTGKANQDFRRRLIPIASSIIATEPLPEDTMARLIPEGRMISGGQRYLTYYRPSPDGRRILFGGRASTKEIDPRVSGARLHRVLVHLFPELAEVKISHSWSGYVAYSFDRLPHTGVHQGIHYAMGYCGSGVVMATYLGHKTGLRVLGKAEAMTAFDGLDFPAPAFYTGTPWFLPAVKLAYAAADRLGL